MKTPKNISNNVLNVHKTDDTLKTPLSQKTSIINNVPPLFHEPFSVNKIK